MIRIMLLTSTFAPSACGKAAPTDAMKFLAARPEHLREVEQRSAI